MPLIIDIQTFSHGKLSFILHFWWRLYVNKNITFSGLKDEYLWKIWIQSVTVKMFSYKLLFIFLIFICEAICQAKGLECLETQFACRYILYY